MRNNERERERKNRKEKKRKKKNSSFEIHMLYIYTHHALHDAINQSSLAGRRSVVFECSQALVKQNNNDSHCQYKQQPHAEQYYPEERANSQPCQEGEEEERGVRASYKQPRKKRTSDESWIVDLVVRGICCMRLTKTGGVRRKCKRRPKKHACERHSGASEYIYVQHNRSTTTHLGRLSHQIHQQDNERNACFR